jgi:hypothetical protein
MRTRLGRLDQALVAVATVVFFAAWLVTLFCILFALTTFTAFLQLIVATVILLFISIMRSATLCCGKDCYGMINSVVTLLCALAATACLFLSRKGANSNGDEIDFAAVMAATGVGCEFAHLFIIFMFGVPESDGTFHTYNPAYDADGERRSLVSKQ